jgi:hypothetical protein
MTQEETIRILENALVIIETPELWHMTSCSVVHKFPNVGVYTPGHIMPCARIPCFHEISNSF